MAKHSDTQELLALGDSQMRQGELKTAAKTYTRCADQLLAGSCLDCAQEHLHKGDAVAALRVLTQVEKLIGATERGQTLTAEAYERLGQDEIADNFRRATTRHLSKKKVATLSA